MLFQPFVSHHQSRAVPVEQLQPIGFPRAEYEDGAGERIVAQLVLHDPSQAVMTFKEVDGLRRHHDPNPVRREDHVRACSAKTSSATRAADVAGSRRSMTGLMIRSIGVVTGVSGGSGK